MRSREEIEDAIRQFIATIPKALESGDQETVMLIFSFVTLLRWVLCQPSEFDFSKSATLQFLTTWMQ
jgi:hypothetical protein